MASLISRLSLGNGAHQIAEDTMFLLDKSLSNQHIDDVDQVITLLVEPGNDYDAYKLATTVQATMDITEGYDPLEALDGSPLTVDVLVEDDRRLGLAYRYDPNNKGRMNRELGSNNAMDEIDVQWPGLVGNVEEFGYIRTTVSSNISIIIEQDGENGGLDPSDPSDPPDPPVDPGEDPDVIVVGGISEIDVTVNPNSVYTLRLAVSDGAEIKGISGMDSSMSWNARTHTLTGWMLGPGPKMVSINLGESEAKLYIRAYPTTQHII